MLDDHSDDSRPHPPTSPSPSPFDRRLSARQRGVLFALTGFAVVIALLWSAGAGSAAWAQEATDAAVPAGAGAAAQSGNGVGNGVGDGEEERVPSSAWLLPIIDLKKFEPVTWTLALCSVAAVTLIIQGFLRVRRGTILPRESTRQIEQLVQQRQLRELLEFTQQDESFVSRSLTPALKRAPHFAEMRDALEAGVAEETAEQFRKLDYINLLANVGPLLGLLGTVIGIMDAFLAMRRAGGAAEVSALAEGISTALGTTLVGLCLAVPCLVFYSILRNRADRLTQEGAEQAEDFLLMLRGDARPTPSPSSSAPVARPVAPPPARAAASPVPTAVGQVTAPANAAQPRSRAADPASPTVPAQ